MQKFRILIPFLYLGVDSKRKPFWQKINMIYDISPARANTADMA